MTSALIWPVAIPMGAALLACLSRRYTSSIATLACLLNLIACAMLARQLVVAGEQTLLLSGWQEGLAIALQADSFSVVMLSMTALVFFLVSIYATFYVRGRAYSEHFWSLWLLLLLALNLIYLSRDLFNIYIGLELLGISASALAVLQASKRALQAGLRYLTLGLLGSLLYLLGVVLIYTRYGTLDWHLLGSVSNSDVGATFALAAMTAGLLLKCALFPLHFWLPNTHANAPPPVSAVLSALVVKSGFYLLVRLWTTLGAQSMEQVSALLGILGAIAVIWGSFCALRAQRLKMLAAYSTVAQMGYLFLFLPLLATAATPVQYQTLFSAMLIFMLAHGFAKASIFLTAGYVQHRLGHDEIDRLGGLARTLPLATFSIGLAGVALIGLPPSGGFLAKWVLLGEAVSAGSWHTVVVVLAGTVLAAAYTFRLLGKAIGVPDVGVESAPSDLSMSQSIERNDTFSYRVMILVALLLAFLATLVLGLFSNPIWLFAGIGA